MDAIYKLTNTERRKHYIQNHYKIDWMIKKHRKLFTPNVWYCDIGIGDGYSIKQIAPTVSRCACVDKSTWLLEQVECEGYPVSVEDWKPKNVYGVITAFDVLEHTKDIKKALANIREALSGHLLITIPLNENMADRQTQCPKCDNVFHAVGHNHSWDICEFIHLLMDSGFNVLRTGEVPFKLSDNPLMNWAANVGVNMLEPVTFTKTLYVHAT